jgi:hypothetical protein
MTMSPPDMNEDLSEARKDTILTTTLYLSNPTQGVMFGLFRLNLELQNTIKCPLSTIL